VTWREARGPVRAGKLTLGARGLRLEGGTLRGRLSAQTIVYGDLVGIDTARRPGERIAGRPTLLLKRVERASLAIASVDGPGCLHEFAERLGQAIADTVPA
jgi:hypothetical protein